MRVHVHVCVYVCRSILVVVYISFHFSQAHVVKEAILNVLRLSVLFSERWREGVERFGVHEAERMEVEFSRCSHFLVGCLNNVTKRGHFPHCESKHGLRLKAI